MEKAPCAECENKGCGLYHDKCEKYKQYKEKHNKELEEYHKVARKSGNLNVARRDGIGRMKRIKVSNGIFTSRKK